MVNNNLLITSSSSVSGSIVLETQIDHDDLALKIYNFLTSPQVGTFCLVAMSEVAYIDPVSGNMTWAATIIYSQNNNFNS